MPPKIEQIGKQSALCEVASAYKYLGECRGKPKSPKSRGLILQGIIQAEMDLLWNRLRNPTTPDL